ncbi:hypothetical protein HTS88_21370 [Pseudarthrobacter oxydans]|uniref:hypothetical protein n=1 Tax=Pseudarthrobacter oxydans TaxID=1671 RepID=UPI0015748EE6|nr:hypothetical protein [Pseudarthrobacter oxydans]NSX38929.1 hypothetical protein [Pseudarthrobacter oxydans]
MVFSAILEPVDQALLVDEADENEWALELGGEAHRLIPYQLTALEPLPRLGSSVREHGVITIPQGGEPDAACSAAGPPSCPPEAPGHA